MTELCFRKIWNTFGSPRIVIFENGQFTKPLLILDKRDKDLLDEEWEEKQQEKEGGT